MRLRGLLICVATAIGLVVGCHSQKAEIVESTPIFVEEIVQVPAQRDLAVMQVNVHEYLLRGYRKGRANTWEIVKSAFVVGKKLDLDPLLILSVAAIESGLDPKAHSIAGAQGVMQVHVPVHSESFSKNGIQKSAFNTSLNIEVGSQILKNYIERTGSVHEALKWYVGARFLKSDKGYAKRVLAEMSRLDYAADGEVLNARRLLRLKEPAPFFEMTYPRRLLPYAGVLEAKTRFASQKVRREVKKVDADSNQRIVR